MWKTDFCGDFRKYQWSSRVNIIRSLNRDKTYLYLRWMFYTKWMIKYLKPTDRKRAGMEALRFICVGFLNPAFIMDSMTHKQNNSRWNGGSFNKGDSWFKVLNAWISASFSEPISLRLLSDVVGLGSRLETKTSQGNEMVSGLLPELNKNQNGLTYWKLKSSLAV